MTWFAVEAIYTTLSKSAGDYSYDGHPFATELRLLASAPRCSARGKALGK